MNRQNLERAVRELVDRKEIGEVITRYARAVDRLNLQLLKSVYHPDGVNLNALYTKNAHEHCEINLSSVRELFSSTMHYVPQTSIELDGTRAASETYYLAGHVVRGDRGALANFFGENYAIEMEQNHQIEIGHNYWCGGRYLDKWEKRENIWKIIERRVTSEWTEFSPEGIPGAGSLLSQVPGFKRLEQEDPVFGLFRSVHSLNG